MTTFKTAESPFKSDNTASNMCGFTLMNNQVGVVVAQVLWTKLANVTVTYLPSMIRVDGERQVRRRLRRRRPRRWARSRATSTRPSSRRACPPTTAG